MPPPAPRPPPPPPRPPPPPPPRRRRRGLVGGRSGWALAAALLVGATAVTATLNLAVRRGASTIVQGVVAVALPDQGVALVESVGGGLLSRRGAFLLRAGAETLVRP